MRWPAGRRRERREVASGPSAAKVPACCLRRSCSACASASIRSCSSRSLLRCSSARRSASSRSRSSFCCSSARLRSTSRACWYSWSCSSRRWRSSTCCSRRAMISPRCDSISSRHAASSAEVWSTCTSPLSAPMTRISSTLAGSSTQNQGYCLARTSCETWCASMRATSPPQSRKFSSSIERTKSLPRTSAQKLCAWRECSLCR
mmetsp:Transcript_6925/g.19606  ORF Transcript_6925/g.19606 Transcript_6925/m.19606 type:complete len:204 (-) Transcript_6925:626-1237(-)